MGIRLALGLLSQAVNGLGASAEVGLPLVNPRLGSQRAMFQDLIDPQIQSPIPQLRMYYTRGGVSRSGA